PAPPDLRTSALMSPSVEILQQLDLVSDPDEIGEPLTKIRLIDATSRLLRAPEALFESSEAGVAAFGWNFANMRLAQNMLPLIKKYKNLKQIPLSASKMKKDAHNWEITLSDGSKLQAPLIIGADGKKSFVRQNSNIAIKQQNHTQSALVCDLMLERELEGESVEYHYENGPFTLVPAGGKKANLVWVDDGASLEKIAKLPASEIQEILQKKSQNLFGRLSLETRAFVFPLSSHHASEMGKDGVVLVGESGHAFPPIGAQGLNLSLRDVAQLVELIDDIDVTNPDWASNLSSEYSSKRQADIIRTNRMVDTLFKTLLSDYLPAQMLRMGGMWALKSIAPLRKRAFEMGMGPR
ncbi:2-polyprenyl-6-methoxyphenol hydroxylase, partial [hydrothermal vent metagenome]